MTTTTSTANSVTDVSIEKSLKGVYDLIQSETGEKARVIGAPEKLIRFFNLDFKAAIIFNQLLFWANCSPKVTEKSNPDGYHWKTYEGWYDELGFSREEVSARLNYLAGENDQGLALIEVKVMKRGDGTPVNHYRILWENFFRSFQKFVHGVGEAIVSLVGRKKGFTKTKKQNKRLSEQSQIDDRESHISMIGKVSLPLYRSINKENTNKEELIDPPLPPLKGGMKETIDLQVIEKENLPVTLSGIYSEKNKEEDDRVRGDFFATEEKATVGGATEDVIDAEFVDVVQEAPVAQTAAKEEVSPAAETAPVSSPVEATPERKQKRQRKSDEAKLVKKEQTVQAVAETFNQYKPDSFLNIRVNQLNSDRTRRLNGFITECQNLKLDPCEVMRRACLYTATQTYWTNPQNGKKLDLENLMSNGKLFRYSQMYAESGLDNLQVESFSSDVQEYLTDNAYYLQSALEFQRDMEYFNRRFGTVSNTQPDGVLLSA
jgi:hypothetical protein